MSVAIWCYELFELTDAVRCADGLVKSPVDLTLMPEHRGGYGALYCGLNRRRIDVRICKSPDLSALAFLTGGHSSAARRFMSAASLT